MCLLNVTSMYHFISNNYSVLLNVLFKQKIPKDPCAKVLFDYEPKEQGYVMLMVY